ncbi:hypothetical protein GALMADRAFT_134836 [Galerina marginata CBS 339.88]|uniref:Uncharacterized protein n=1 Tax=Galerina marginata (strain CBS 339.88) TaxID=685588 RepID=A0A067TR10_GALM3|nr:hypothetical protein GALMADRAFT_134836 [Galerina marginata CBS 339.88]
MTLFSDALQHPSKALSDLYRQNRPKGIDSFPSTVTAHFSAIFKAQDAFEQVPALDLQHPPESFSDRSMVVFNAMIQDTSLPPELYVATRKNEECGGWGLSDDIPSDDDVRHEDLRECSTFWAVSIPGLSPWCGGAQSGSPHQSTQPHKYPITHASHVGVQLKIYDEKVAQPLRTTDILSFVGILTSEPLHTSIDLPSPANVPTIHVLFTIPIPSTIIPRSFPDPSILLTVETIRKELIQWVANEGLAGDCLLAEWVFLCALARVRSRHPPVLPLSLTISRFPSPPSDTGPTPALYHILSHIFPLVTALPLTLDAINSTPFYPESKDEDLHSGFLQQPKGSILLLTEGGVTEGGISSKGVTNIRSAQQMMKDQTLEYAFPFSDFQFETDVNFLITTEGRQSTFFKTDINIPLRPVASSNVAQSLYKSVDAINLPSSEKLLLFRQLVGGSKTGNVVVNPELGKHVEEDFVRERSDSRSRPSETGSTFTPDDLVQRMLVARLHALSLHQAEVKIDNWESAKELEKEAN